MKLWLKRIVVGLGCLLGILVIAGTIFEAISRQQAAEKYPVQGKLVDIGGRKIQLDCRGAGSPTVVLESGLDHFGSLSWAKVHDSIAQTTRVCTYSRAGIMWSETAPGDFDSQRTAQDLHTALIEAGEQTPFVMVGHSAGGIHIMTFTSLYDKEVAGLVFVDASHPNQFEQLRKVNDKFADLGIVNKIPPLLVDALSRIGVIRLITALGLPLEHIPSIVISTTTPYVPQSASSVLKELQAIDTTFANAKFRQLGDRPIVVLTATQPPNPEELKLMQMSTAQERAINAVWQKLHQDMATWSSHSRHELVSDASHYIQFDRPDVVIKAIKEVVNDVRTANLKKLN
jgi:pimeloyl-ACP methyl ester carboxylesterase